ncbi:hypothetical protein M405DRAFT_835804 [Rhizopogon salebrosus TDB-379]|nr:hypothetical protein M405DRAFT_835804 [Rhizopogon salebrosus TDB-379]
MTLTRVHNCDDGWLVGQHVRLRVFFSNRAFKSHPLIIPCAPPSHSCLSSPGFILAARTNGDWTWALDTYTRKEQERLQVNGKSEGVSFVSVKSSVYLGRYESALLVAGGSGITFTLGLLDDIVGRCIKLGRSQGERTRKIELAWCIRSFDKISCKDVIEWFAPMLIDIGTAASNSSINLHISIYVTCLCDPEAVPAIPNSIVMPSRPSVHDPLASFINLPCENEDSRDTVTKRRRVAVCASDSESITREARNPAARIGLTASIDVGGIALHTGLFSL